MNNKIGLLLDKTCRLVTRIPPNRGEKRDSAIKEYLDTKNELEAEIEKLEAKAAKK